VIRTGRVRALLPVLVAVLLPAAGAAAPAAPDPPGSGRPPRVRLTFDLSVPLDYLRLVENKIIDDDSLDEWVALPGNAELLRMGAPGGVLTKEALRENLWHSILGHAGRTGEGLGSLAFQPLADLRSMLHEIREREPGIRERVLSHAISYMPSELGSLDATVYFHLGGGGVARTRDAIYFNLTRLHQLAPPWLDAVEPILAHELIHMAHRSLDVVPSDAVTPMGLFAVAIAQIHAEGIARHAGYDLMKDLPMQGGYAETIRAQHDADLASFDQAFHVIARLRDTCLVHVDMPACRKMIRDGLQRDATIYATGHGMARAIERALGRRTLAQTLVTGPVRFFELYEQATRMLPGLPVMQQGVDEDLKAAQAELDGMRRSWKLRREAMRLHREGDYAGAIRALERLVGAEPYDPIDAYNMACALARKGEPRQAVEWLEKAVSLGYQDKAYLEQDSDLDSLRDRDDYRRLLSSFGAAPPPADSPNSSR